MSPKKLLLLTKILDELVKSLESIEDSIYQINSLIKSELYDEAQQQEVKEDE